MKNTMNVKEITNLLEDKSVKNIALIEKAYSFAEKAHANQKRYSGETYFTHIFLFASFFVKLR